MTCYCYYTSCDRLDNSCKNVVRQSNNSRVLDNENKEKNANNHRYNAMDDKNKKHLENLYIANRIVYNANQHFFYPSKHQTHRRNNLPLIGNLNLFRTQLRIVLQLN